MSGNIYPDLVRVFYTNLQIVGDTIYSHVKGVDMEITREVWSDVAGLKYVGLRINKGTLELLRNSTKCSFIEVV